MSITDLFIARHGETEYNRLNKIQGRGIDEPLNELGRRQAAALVYCLKDHPIDVVISSSLRRSRESAEPVAKALGVEVLSYSELDEMNFGTIEGKPFVDTLPYLQQIQSTWQSGQTTHPLEGGESPQQVYDRASSRVQKLLQEHAQKTMLFVLHGRLIKILLSQWLGYGLHQMDKVEHSNCSVNHLRWDGKSYNPVFLHKTDHLSDCSSSPQFKFQSKYRDCS